MRNIHTDFAADLVACFPLLSFVLALSFHPIKLPQIKPIHPELFYMFCMAGAFRFCSRMAQRTSSVAHWWYQASYARFMGSAEHSRDVSGDLRVMGWFTCTSAAPSGANSYENSVVSQRSEYSRRGQRCCRCAQIWT